MQRRPLVVEISEIRFDSVDRGGFIIEREKNVKTRVTIGTRVLMNESHRTMLSLAAEIVAAHVRHNDVAIDALSNLIRSVYDTLVDVGRNFPGPSMATALASVHQYDHSNGDAHDLSNVHVHPLYGQTVFEDRLICLEDGLSMKMLKRHLMTVHGMTPEAYQAKWGLPNDYPMVAATYARLRSSLALQSGLGLKSEARFGKSRKTRQFPAAKLR